MKAKKSLRQINRTANLRREDPLPHELGLHLFAMIRRNLQTRRTSVPTAAPAQMTFAF